MRGHSIHEKNYVMKENMNVKHTYLITLFGRGNFFFMVRCSKRIMQLSAISSSGKVSTILAPSPQIHAHKVLLLVNTYSKRLMHFIHSTGLYKI